MKVVNVHPRRAASLAVVLLATTVVMVLTLAVVMRASQSLYLARSATWQMQVYQVTLAGIAEATSKLNAHPDWETAGAWLQRPFTSIGDTEYRIEVVDASANRVTLRATGRLSRSPQRELVLYQRVGRGNAFARGFFSDDRPIELQGNVTVDHYDTRLGTYAQTRSDSPGVDVLGTDYSGVPAITVQGSADIGGDVVVGPGSDPDRAIQVIGGGDKPSTGVLTTVDLAPAGEPAGSVAGPVVINAKKGTAVVPPGHYSNLDIRSGTAELLPGTYYFRDGVSFGNNTRLLVQQGPVLLYFGSRFTMQAGATVSNTTGRPANLLLLGVGMDTPLPHGTVTLQGGPDASLCLYAPTYTVHFGGGPLYFGAMVGYGLIFEGNSSLHYDTAAGEVVIPGFVGPMEVLARWLGP